MLEIIQVEADEHKNSVRNLFWEYLTRANAMVIQEFDVSFDIQITLEQDMVKLYQFTPPEGRLLLGKYETHVVGCVGLKKID